MKRHQIFRLLGFLCIPIISLFVVVVYELSEPAHDKSKEHYSRNLKRPVSFTNQMFLSPTLFDLAHTESIDPHHVWGGDRPNRQKPYLKTARQIKYEGKVEDPCGRFPSHTGEHTDILLTPPEEWPKEARIAIKRNPDLRSVGDAESLLLTNTGDKRITFSSTYPAHLLSLIIDNNGDVWHIERAWTLDLANWNERSRLSSIGIEFGTMPKYPTHIEPNESIYFLLPTRWHRPKKQLDPNLKYSVFFVIVGEDDKIIHIYEKPLDKLPTSVPTP